MANYQSSLTGQQMDDALTQMNNRVPEGWAVGERDGVPVGEESLYYHNNAKYYAEYAQGQAERAEAAVPAGTAGAVFFDRAQTLTTVQQEQARQNIKAGRSNPNLLDNPWFTVNQRGFTSTSSNTTMTVDRWIAQNMRTSGVCSYSNGIITIDATNAVGGGLSFGQSLDIADLTGKTVTLSVMLSNGDVYSASAILPARTASQQTVIGTYIGSSTAYQMRLYANATSTVAPYVVQFIVAMGSVLSIKAVKLELGSVSTLANDAPPNYAEELAKCQRYFIRIGENGTYCPLGFGSCGSATQAYLTIALPAPMRANPTVTVTGAFHLWAIGGLQAITQTVFRARNQNLITLTCTVASGLTTNNFVSLVVISNGNYIDLSADL